MSLEKDAAYWILSTNIQALSAFLGLLVVAFVFFASESKRLPDAHDLVQEAQRYTSFRSLRWISYFCLFTIIGKLGLLCLVGSLNNPLPGHFLLCLLFSCGLFASCIIWIGRLGLYLVNPEVLRQLARQEMGSSAEATGSSSEFLRLYNELNNTLKSLAAVKVPGAVKFKLPELVHSLMFHRVISVTEKDVNNARDIYRMQRLVSQSGSERINPAYMKQLEELLKKVTESASSVEIS